MPLPMPHKNETQDAFISRCMHEAYGAAAPADRTQEQAVAMCHQAWRDRNKSEKADVGAMGTGGAGGSALVGPEGGYTVEGVTHRMDCPAIASRKNADCNCGAMDMQPKATRMMNRAYSLLSIKSVNEAARTITGWATTPKPDRLHDVMVPQGAKFALPMPLLWQHDSKQPIGHVTAANVSDDGILITAKIASVKEAGRLKDRLDEQWQTMKAGLVSGLSIGFKGLKQEFDKAIGGIRFKEWDWLELSVVTIPANSEATIATVKSLDRQQAVPGQKTLPVVHLNPPGAPGQTKPKAAEVKPMPRSIAEQITALENKRAASAARMEAVMQLAVDEDRTSNAAEQEEFDTLSQTVEAVDSDLVRLRAVERARAVAAKPIVKAESHSEGSVQRGEPIVIKREPNLGDGIGATQMWKCLIVSRLEYRPPAEIAKLMYGYDDDSRVVRELDALVTTKASVASGNTISGGWGAQLVGAETTLFADFVEFLRKKTILGRFGVDGIPALRAVAFRMPLITQTTGGAGYWVGEAKAKPLTKFDFTRTTLQPLKVANISALTEEEIRYSNPKADVVVRDSLVAALQERLDTDFINPAKTAVTNVSPASITNGAPAIASSAGTDADSIRLDIRALWHKFTQANNPPTTGVWVLSSDSAAALAAMVNPLGQPAFPGMTVMGGTLFGMPVIASDFVGNIAVLMNASDIYLADEGGVAVDVSREASLEMSDAPTGDSSAPTAVSLVSLWQTNTVGIRAERTINWLRRRAVSVVYTTGVDWGGTVPTA